MGDPVSLNVVFEMSGVVKCCCCTKKDKCGKFKVVVMVVLVPGADSSFGKLAHDPGQFPAD